MSARMTRAEPRSASALEPAKRHGCDELALSRDEAQDQWHGGDDVAGHEHRPLSAAGSLEVGEANLQRVCVLVTDRDERPDEVVPRAEQR